MDGRSPTDEAAVASAESRGAASQGPGRLVLLRSLLRTLLTCTGLLALYYLLPLDGGFAARPLLILLAGLFGVALLVGWQVLAILRAAHPAMRAIEAVALSLPLFLLLFAAAYFVMGSTDASSFNEPLSRTDCLYFVVTVFATVGFGDIHPVSELARLLTTVQMVGDLVLIGLVLRLFVAAVNRGRRRVTGRGNEDRGNEDR